MLWLRIILSIFILGQDLYAESIRLAWTAPVNVVPQSYAVLIYEGFTGPCADRNITKTTWENTSSVETTYVITRPPGCYEFTVSYYINGAISGARSNFLMYQIKPGEVAGPAPPLTSKTPTNLRFP